MARRMQAVFGWPQVVLPFIVVCTDTVSGRDGNFLGMHSWMCIKVHFQAWQNF